LTQLSGRAARLRHYSAFLARSLSGKVALIERNEKTIRGLLSPKRAAIAERVQSER
jgi:hypothetical protein